MAKQVGPIWLQTTWDDLTFYKMEGKYYARKKSSLTREKVLTHRAFAKTRRSASRLVTASKIASAIYKALPSDWRQFWMYRAFTGEAINALKAGQTPAQVYDQLWATYAAYWKPATKPALSAVLTPTKAPHRKTNKPRIRHRSENPHLRRYRRLLGPNHCKSKYDYTPNLEAQARKEAARQRNREWYELTCLRKAQSTQHITPTPHKRAGSTRLRSSRRRAKHCSAIRASSITASANNHYML